jgi:hypothetical protein
MISFDCNPFYIIKNKTNNFLNFSDGINLSLKNSKIYSSIIFTEFNSNKIYIL